MLDKRKKEEAKKVKEKINIVQEEVISNETYTEFVDTGKVDNVVIENIAEKIKVNEPLSEREFAIFNDKTSEINEILKDETPIDSITNGQKKKVVQYLFHKVLSSIDISKDFTTQDVLKDIKGSFETHLSHLEGTKEYNFLVENKDSILGLGAYSNEINTVKSEIESFLNQEVYEGEEDTETQLNDEGNFEKNNNKASFENDKNFIVN